MFGTEILEVLIGLFLVYFVLSTMASALTEVVSSLLALRAANLEKGVKMLLQDDEAAIGAFYAHPVIRALTPPGESRFGVGQQRPSYIPADLFAKVYLAIPGDMGSAVNQVFAAFGGATHPDLEKNVAKWFDQAMDRVTGWYKRKAQLIILVFGAAAIVVSNADTIAIANALWQDDTIREQIVAVAQREADAGQASDSSAEDELDTSTALRSELSSLQILGWEEANPDIEDPRERPVGWGWASKLVGFLITLGAVSLGAPFWFDMMSKLLSLRRGGTQSAGGAGNIPQRVT